MAISTAKGLPRLVIALVVAGCAWVDLDLKLWQLRDRVIEWDAHSYYAYLPAQLIYDDIRLIKSDYRFDEDYFLFWPSTAAIFGVHRVCARPNANQPKPSISGSRRPE